MFGTRFSSNRTEMTSLTPLTADQLRKVAPSIFASEKHTSRSERYAYISTEEVLKALQKEGFQPFSVAQSRTRVPGKQEYTKHLLRLRHASDITVRNAESPEVVIINSHDGTSSYKLISGHIVYVCTNGLISGDIDASISVHHTGKNITEEVLQGAYMVLDHAKAAKDQIIEMKALPLNRDEVQVFGEAALVARYGEEGHKPITVDQLLHPQHSEQVQNNLWNVFNRAQKSLVQGGMTGVSANGRRRARIRPVTGISENVRLNQALDRLAKGMLKLKNS